MTEYRYDLYSYEELCWRQAALWAEQARETNSDDAWLECIIALLEALN